MQLKIVAPTVSEFSELYLERYAIPHKKSWRLDEGHLRLHINPRLGDYCIDGVTRGLVSELHTDVGREMPYLANRLVEVISKMWTLAIEWEYLPETFRNPAKGIKQFREVDRARFLTREELERVYRGIHMELEVHVRAAFLLLLCTALRKNEILKLRWDDVNLQDGYLRVADTKNGDTVYQPLNAQALAILAEIPRHSQNPFVIAGQSGKPRNTITKAWERIRKRAQVEDVRIHDLRRTGGSFLAQQGVPLQLIGKVLNHRDIKSTMVYAQFADKHKREAVDQLGDYFEAVADVSLDKLFEREVR